MRFPLRLAATLYSQKFQPPFNSPTSPIFSFSPLVNHFGVTLSAEQVTPELEWHTPEACVDAANRVGARVVWLGTAEPLMHPAIGRVVAALLKGGRYVFLHSSGFGLRKRIHEFQPHSRLFLTLEVPNGSSVSGAAGNASRPFLEAFDVAGLSGFCRCAHITVDAQTDGSETARLFDWLDAQGLEGMVVASANSPQISGSSAIHKNVAEVRSAIRSRGWRTFSRLLEESRLTNVRSELQETFPSANAGTCEENA